MAKCIVNVRNVPVSSISLDEELINLKIGSNKKLVSHILPSNASNKEVKWESSNSSVALVSSNGVVTGLKEGETVISVSTFDGNKRYECKVIVNGFQLDSWTIMIYMCGSTLESDPSYKHAATSDLQEICSIDKPNDVNVIVEAGGASRWGNTFSYVLDSNHINRFHLENDYYALDAKLPQANMGDSQTLESFMDWGLSKYPAERTMVILWNHGGGLNGVCFDDRYDSGNDSLLNSEVDKAMNNVFNARSYQNKLEVIGYDACLMQVMDIAEYNSHYFNYMIASQEAENDGGWDYDVWLPTLYNNNSAASIKTEKVLTSICDSFINDNGGVYGIDYQTMSWLDLSKMNSFYQSFEEMSSYMDGTILNSSNRGTFANLVKKVKNFGDDNYSDYYVDYCLFDVVDLLHKMSANSSFNKELMNTYIDTCLLNVKQLIGYNISQRSAGESFGLCCFYSVVSSSEQKDVYLQSETHFINWRSLSMKYGF